MSNTKTFIDKLLSHAAPEFYDAAKAHEYYLRTRELKGRQASSGLKTQKKKEAWEYSKSEIAKAKKEEQTKESDAKKAEYDKIRTSATAQRQEIAAKLQKIFADLTGQRRAEGESITKEAKGERDKASADHEAKIKKIAEETSRKLAALPTVPKGATAQQAEAIKAERAQKLEQIRGDSGKQRDAVNAEYKTTLAGITNTASQKRESASADSASKKQSQQESTRAERDKVTAQTKESIDTARKSYEDKKAALIQRYEEASQKEYDAIKTTVR